MASINRLTSPVAGEDDDARLNRLIGALSQTNMLPAAVVGGGAAFRGYRPSTNVQVSNGMDAPTANMARLSMYDAVQRGMNQNAASADNRPMTEAIDDTEPMAAQVDVGRLLQHLRNTEPYNHYAGANTGMGWSGGTPSMMLGASPSPSQQGGGGYSPSTNPADASLANSITQALQGPDADEMVRRVRALLQNSK